jgi:hypothetical protein
VPKAVDTRVEADLKPPAPLVPPAGMPFGDWRSQFVWRRGMEVFAGPDVSDAEDFDEDAPAQLQPSRWTRWWNRARRGSGRRPSSRPVLQAGTWASAACTQKGGACIDANTCGAGTVVRGICPGPAGISCCVPKAATPTPTPTTPTPVTPAPSGGRPCLNAGGIALVKGFEVRSLPCCSRVLTVDADGLCGCGVASCAAVCVFRASSPISIAIRWV